MTQSSISTAGGASASAGRIELHTHLEGSLTPARLIDLAGKHGHPGLPAECLDESGTTFVFDGFLGFLNLYKRITRLLQTPADHHALALDLGDQLAADGVVYAEVSVSYGVLLKRCLLYTSDAADELVIV